LILRVRTRCSSCRWIRRDVNPKTALSFAFQASLAPGLLALALNALACYFKFIIHPFIGNQPETAPMKCIH
jgi:hypothetical protein